MIEHPGPPRDGEKVSIFRTPIYALLLRLPECALRIIRQQFLGSRCRQTYGYFGAPLAVLLRFDEQVEDGFGRSCSSGASYRPKS